MPGEGNLQNQEEQQKKLYQQDLKKSVDVSLGEDQSFQYGLNLDQSMFTLSNGNKTLDQHRKSRTLLRNRISADDKLLRGKARAQRRERDGQGQEDLAALNNLLDKDMKEFYDGEHFEMNEAKKLNEIFDKAYEEVINACLAYEAAKNPKHSTGIRRKQKVIRMRQICEADRARFSLGTEFMRMNRLTINRSEVKSPRDLLALVRCEDELSLAEIQKEGNSSNVYKVKLAQYDEKSNSSSTISTRISLT